MITIELLARTLQDIGVADVETSGAEETEQLGRILARLLDAGDVVALFGELGSGKTTLIKGIVAGLGATELVTSPSFTIQHQYRGAALALYHFDFYRLESAAAVQAVGCEEFFDGDGICLVEWPERALALLPPRRWEIYLQQHAAATTHRQISIRRRLPT